MSKIFINSPLKLARMRANLRQLDLAKTIGVSEGVISKIETGRVKPNPIVLEQIKNVLKLSENDIQEMWG